VFDARRLPTFREVARRGSFAAAAEALCFTPSAVSQQIAALEREVGVRLFERSNHGVRLTDAGERLLGHVDALLDGLARAAGDLAPAGAAGDHAPPLAEVDLAPAAEQPRPRLHLVSLNGIRVVFAGWP
jgi:DNA-binding transcriptional LysR family regulator